MAKRFLVPVDQGLSSEPAMALVADAERAAGGTVRLLHVAPVPDIVVNAEGRTVAYADKEICRPHTGGERADAPVDRPHRCSGLHPTRRLEGEQT